MTKRVFLTLLASAAVFSALPRADAQEVAEIPFWHTPEGTAALGGGLRFGQSPYLASDSEDERKLDLVPLYLYNGKYLFARGTSGGIHIVRNEALELNLYTRYRFQQLDPDSNAYYEGLEERKQSLDAGFELALRRNWGELRFDWVTDTLNRHGGNEARASYRYRIDSGPFQVSPFISWTWQDANLTNYYFGVSEAEATPERPAYEPGDSQWVSFGLNASWQLTDNIIFFGNVAFAGTQTEVINSPLVEEDSLSSAFVGGTYQFGNARKPDYIMDEERIGEWSWRELPALPNMETQRRIRFAWFRHYEEDEGNGNFSSYAAYIMARGTGYSPWSKEEVFRWGFGFGMSYADTVPIAEQRKQEAKGDNTAHFLNYLEMTLDFPLRRVTKVRWLERCYAGLTVVHRSGIFGTSDFLGDVSGGSDWITAHLECTS